jgi:hypothetical protein
MWDHYSMMRNKVDCIGFIHASTQCVSYNHEVKYKHMIITDNNGKVVSEAAVIKSYFGMKPEQSLQGFMAEIKELSPESKTELAIGAAQNLGWTVS